MSASYAVGVCGFGRCGSSMVMAMLAAGGLVSVPGSSPRSHELDGEQALLDARPDGHAIKLLDHFVRLGLPPASGWRFVWMDRDPVQQAKSHAKLGALAGLDLGPVQQELFARSYMAERPTMLGQLRAVGPVLVLNYERVLAAPRKAARLLRREIWPALDVDAAVGAVHVRDASCAPDLAFELAEDGPF